MKKTIFRLSDKQVIDLLEKQTIDGNYRITVSYRYTFGKELVDRLKRRKDLMDLRELIQRTLQSFSNDLEERSRDLFRHKKE